MSINTAFFKNARIYRLSEAYPFIRDAFDNALAEFKFQPCSAQESIRTGFCEPIEQSKDIAHHWDGLTLIAIKTQKKVLPSAAINEELAPVIKSLEAKKCQPLSRKEKQAAKEAIVQLMLPRAFSRSTLTRAIIDHDNGLVIVEAASDSNAETLLSWLRKALGSFRVTPCFDKSKFTMAMQKWVAAENLPANLSLGNAVRFKAPDHDGATARFENHILDSAEVQSHVEDKLVTEIELQKTDVITFRMTDTAALKRIQWHEKMQDANDELGWDDVALRLRADLLLARGTLVDLISAFSEVAA